jgi:hypothetical protein
MSDWGVFWQAIGTISAIIFGSVGLYKIWQEIKNINDQNKNNNERQEKDSKLRRTEFFINQHRRLFDDEKLFKILSLVDSDSPELAVESIWDDKRKFLTFLEEISLLVYSGQIDKDVAFYMFGYYSMCVVKGINFAVGIHPSEEHWGLLYRFARDSEKFLLDNKNGPPLDISL